MNPETTAKEAMTTSDPPFESAKAENAQPSDPAAVSAAASEWDPNPHARIAALEAELEAAKRDKLLALAEVENTSKRADRRVAENSKYAVANIAKSLLQVADNLGRALLAAPPEARTTSETLKNLATGVELTERELLTVLENQGVRKINALQQAFDANLHNAIQEVENRDVPAGTVVQVFQDGYMMHERLLRPAMVVVSKGGPKREAAPSTANDGSINTTV
jgi:molecular chaperone GrpE